MSRLRPNASSGRDEQGRPIVAELGRAETPDEAADRKAARRTAHYRNQTAINLVLATVASLGLVLLVVLVVVRPTDVPRPTIDYTAAAANAQPTVTARLAAPALPSGWSANRAGLSTGADGVTTWGIGLLTAANGYLALDQGVAANASWVAGHTAQAAASSTRVIAGVTWTVYDRRTSSNAGNVAYALVADFTGSTVVLSGTADDADFTTLATAVVEGLR